MRRHRLFEFTDLAWYPREFRRIQTDYLQFAATRGAGHGNLVPLIARALEHARSSEVLDLCSGGSGPWERLLQHLDRADLPVSVRLSDKYPDPSAIARWSPESNPRIEYLAEPVDALRVPGHLTGMRTIFEGFHHFGPEAAAGILMAARDSRVPIGVFEASLNPRLAPFLLLLGPLMTLLGYAFATPFIRPYRLSRYLWTYLIPLVPLATCWDGVVSLLRVYSVRDLETMTASLQSAGYRWEAGRTSTGTPLFEFIHLIGYPV